MLRSLFSGITGLRAHQTLMDVVSNNIANVNTTGFKSSTVVFEDTLSQTIRNAAAPTPVIGGINPAQIGLGVQLGAVSTTFGQGSAQNTGKSTDLMVQGDGFFVLRNGGESTYSRAGAFTFDTNGRLVTPQGAVVQGWIGTNGVVNTDNPVTDIVVPAGTLIPPTVSTTVTLGGNISAGTTTPMTLGATVYDSTGVGHSLAIVLTTTGSAPPVYTIDVSEPADATVTPVSGSVNFQANGSYDTTTTPPQITLADGSVITIDPSGLTQFGGEKSLSVTKTDGAAAGSLQQFQIGSDGGVLGIFSNGQKLTMAKLALANFNNPPGLEKIGSTSFRATPNSGLAQVGIPGSGGRGGLLGGTLEMSNVDLAQEFTNLIIAQRGFQANSRVITTSDEMLQNLVDIKR
ncbi:MAG: flagellar hook protein FlgE [Actinomycetota bacterium]|nr:flagellar hook protein FlgE [Actinomycetota bacterium]